MQTIYVSPRGNDANPGVSPESALKSLRRAAELAADDSRILLEGGQTHDGCLHLQGLSRLVIGGYGPGTPVIRPGDDTGILLTDCRTVTVSKLRLIGLGFRKCNNSMGVHAVQSEDVHIRSVEASGFHAAGIHFSACFHSDIIGCFAHDNGSVGISVGSSGELYSEHVRVAHCKAYDNAGDPGNRENHSGSGIVIGGSSHVLVEFNEAAGNGWAQRQIHVNGPVGIWCCCGTTDITFRYNIARNNRTQPGAIDGDGLDIDGEVKDGAMEYNYTYDNEGSGYLLCEYWGNCSEVEWENNRASYCVSLDDDYRVPGYGSINMSSPQGEPFRQMRIHNNLLVATRDMHCVIDKNIPSSAEDMRIDHNLLVSDGTAAIQDPEQPYISIHDNRCIEDNTVRESLLKAAPKLTEPRDLLGQPVFRLLKDGTCSETLDKEGPASLFCKKETPKPALGPQLLELQLYGPDLDGSDKFGDVALYYDSIRPGVVTRLTGAGSEVYTPLPWWDGQKTYIVRIEARLQSPDVKACLFIRDAEGNEQKRYLGGSVAGYSITEIPFTAPDNWNDPGRYIGVRLEDGEGNLYVHSLQFLEAPAEYLSTLSMLSDYRCFGDAFIESDTVTLEGPGWAETSFDAHGPVKVEIDYEAKDAIGSLYLVSGDATVLEAVTEGQHTVVLSLNADGMTLCGADMSAESDGRLCIHAIRLTKE